MFHFACINMFLLNFYQIIKEKVTIYSLCPTNKKDNVSIYTVFFIEATNGFEPMIRELQSHALPLG